MHAFGRRRWIKKKILEPRIAYAEMNPCTGGALQNRDAHQQMHACVLYCRLICCTHVLVDSELAMCTWATSS